MTVPLKICIFNWYTILKLIFQNAMLLFKKYDDNINYLSVVAVIKNEAPYIKEWIEYHKLMGVTKFYLYDAATDNTKDILSSYILSGIVEYTEISSKGIQIYAYNDAIYHHRFHTRWLAIIDADEFIVPVDNSPTLVDFLKRYEEYPAIGINWIMYDSNGHIRQPKGLVIENYTRVYMDDNHPGNRHIKSIVNPRKVLWCSNPHYCRYISKHAVTENYYVVDGPFSKYNSTTKIRICHYYSKSKEEFERKCKRGTADSSNHYRTITEIQYNFLETKQDKTMIKYVKYLKHNVSDKLDT